MRTHAAVNRLTVQGVKKRMSEQPKGGTIPGSKDGPTKDQSRDNQENEIEAEQESAAAMDADVPQPPDEEDTTEGQPS